MDSEARMSGFESLLRAEWPQTSYLHCASVSSSEKWDNISAFFAEIFWGSNEWIFVQHLAYDKHHMSLSKSIETMKKSQVFLTNI